ncbi:transcriptional regulator GcvA [Fontisubflavum oceani]|uniref:transcriptional regulator GcvA n=1 Tax=Fontisubflavum oceani TaxID=2978973 RepID=UPI0025B359DF|nr:transcriptional regulator GcvA [Fontisubflavum oceani]WJY22798.1 transcriptional regulator GcvA [Fontisubflavum oceani]
MPDRLPPLTALRAFDAAARHMSFAKAADELHVTPAALSFQIKSLEDHLGAPLFRRLNRAVELTEAGKTLAVGTEPGFDTLRNAWRNVTRALESNTLTVTAGPAFTAKWLAPRLFHFAQAYPEIELRFAATFRILDFDRDDVDVAIRFGMGGRESAALFSKPIINDWVTPMMHPALAEQYSDLASLTRAPLLDQEDTRFLKPPLDWPAWFRAAGLDAAPEISASFNQADHAIDAAAAGGGVVLGRVSLTERDLMEGRLVMPFPLALTTEAHYRFVCPKGAETRPHVAAFLAWLEAEAQSLHAYREGRVFVPAADVAD